MRRVSVSGGSLWTRVVLPLATYRNVKVFLTSLLLLSLFFLIYVLFTEGQGMAFERNASTVALPHEKPSYNPVLATDVRNTRLHYGVVVDCGSSGSRLFVYFWPPHDGNPKELLSIQQMRDAAGKPISMKIEPGLSDFADRPSEASDYLSPLLDFAAKHIPAEKHKETPLYIMATAGLRMLPYSTRESLLADLRVDIELQYDFLFTDTQVEVISGKQEGIYAWISINYALHKFDHMNSDDPMVYVPASGSNEDAPKHMRKRTLGMIDMGGGSIQIAYEVPYSEEINTAQLAEFNLGCNDGDAEHTYRVYVATFLGYGGNVARTRYEQMLVGMSLAQEKANNATTGSVRQVYNYHCGSDGRVGWWFSDFYPGHCISRTLEAAERLPIDDPCLPAGMTDVVHVNDKAYSLYGTGNFMACMDLQKPLLNQTVACNREPCSLNGMYQPPIDYADSEFYGFSEFYYSMEDVLRMAGKYNFKSFQHAAQSFCGTEWAQLQQWYKEGLYPKADERRFKLQCFKSAWIAAVFHGGFHFPQQYGHLTSTQLIRGQEVQWTLGALVYKTRYFPLREIEKYSVVRQHQSWNTSSEQSFYLLIVCLIIVLCAIFLYLRRLRVVPSRVDMSRVPTMSYFMTDPDQAQEGLIYQRDRSSSSYYYNYSGS